jgi:hypothetical protein
MLLNNETGCAIGYCDHAVWRNFYGARDSVIDDVCNVRCGELRDCRRCKQFAAAKTSNARSFMAL